MALADVVKGGRSQLTPAQIVGAVLIAVPAWLVLFGIEAGANEDAVENGDDGDDEPELDEGEFEDEDDDPTGEEHVPDDVTGPPAEEGEGGQSEEGGDH